MQKNSLGGKITHMSPEKPSPEDLALNQAENDRMIRRFGLSGAAELQTQRETVQRFRQALEDDPDDDELKELLYDAKEELELFTRSHDNAGAFKFNRYGRECRRLFFQKEGRGLSFDETGYLNAGEMAAKHRLIVVNMGELDRFNKEGGHAAGDAALTSAAQAIEQTVAARLADQPGKYRMYRFSGNEFMVDLEDIDDDELRSLQHDLAELRPTIEGVSEGAPLTVESCDLTEAVSIVNGLQARLPKDRRLTDADEANRELVEAVRRLSSFRLEVAKFMSRAVRMREKMATVDDAAAQQFFDNYLAKMFKGSGLESLDDFRPPPGEEGDWQARLESLAMANARQRFDLDRHYDQLEQAIIDKRLEERTPLPSGLAPEERLQAADAPLAEIPEIMPGAVLVEAKRQAYLAVTSGADARKNRRAERAWLLEDESRDRGTGLLDRGSYYRDTQEALAAGRQVTTIFVDMGFLKYFDQKGGTAVGDAALKVTAKVLEEATAAGKVYRYGGDEFAVTVEGDEATAREVIERISALRDAAGRIPSTAKSRPEYAPTKLSFNYGVCDRRLMEEIFEDLRAAGRYHEEDLNDPEQRRNFQAELMINIADRRLDEEKAVDRFKLLIREKRDPAYAADANRRAQVDSVVSFSQKAIFSESGGNEEMERLAADPQMEGERLDEAIRSFVKDKLKEARAAAESRRELLDLLVPLHVEIRRLKDSLAEAERRNDLQAEEIAALKTRLQSMENERRQLIASRDAVNDA